MQKSKTPPRKPTGNQDGHKDGRTRKYADWQYVGPTDGKTTKKHTIHIRGKPQEVQYYWCTNHNDGKGQWVRHLPSDCEAGQRRQQKTEGASKKTEGAGKSKTTPQLVSTNVTLREEDEDEDSD